MRRSLALLLVLAAVAPAPALAAKQTPTVVRPSIADTPVRAVTSGNLDFEEMAKRAIGERYWTQFTAAQNRALTAELVTYYQTGYTRGLRAIQEAESTWRTGRERNDSVDVTVRVTFKKDPVEICYRLVRINSRWQPVDIVQDDVSGVETMSGQIRRIMGQEGYDGLLAKLRAKNAQLRAEGS